MEKVYKVSPDPNFVMVAGDDAADEAMFKLAHEKAGLASSDLSTEESQDSQHAQVAGDATADEATFGLAHKNAGSLALFPNLLSEKSQKQPVVFTIRLTHGEDVETQARYKVGEPKDFVDLLTEIRSLTKWQNVLTAFQKKRLSNASVHA